MQKDGDRKTKPEIPIQITKVRFTLKQTHVSCPAERTQCLYTRPLQVRHARHQPNPNSERVRNR